MPSLRMPWQALHKTFKVVVLAQSALLTHETSALPALVMAFVFHSLNLPLEALREGMQNACDLHRTPSSGTLREPLSGDTESPTTHALFCPLYETDNLKSTQPSCQECSKIGSS